MSTRPLLTSLLRLGLCGGLVACAPLDRVDLAWNALFEVDTASAGEGCDSPTEPAEPLSPLIGIGLAGLDDIMSIYWCTSTESCSPAPWATAWLDEVSETRAEGDHGFQTLIGTRLCQISWAGVSATLEGDALSLETQTFSSAPLSVSGVAECDVLLRSFIGSACDETWSIEATRLP